MTDSPDYAEKTEDVSLDVCAAAMAEVQGFSEIPVNEWWRGHMALNKKHRAALLRSLKSELSKKSPQEISHALGPLMAPVIVSLLKDLRIADAERDLMANSAAEDCPFRRTPHQTQGLERLCIMERTKFGIQVSKQNSEEDCRLCQLAQSAYSAREIMEEVDGILHQ